MAGPEELSTQRQSADAPRGDRANVEKTLKENFVSRDYLSTYYPENPDTGGLLEALRQLPQGPASARVDIRNIVADTGLASEMVENVFILDFQRKVAGEILRVFPEDHIHILDVGGGPTVYQHALASLSADRITHSDLLPQNLKEVQHWVDGASNAYDWDAYFGLSQKMLRADAGYQATLHQQKQSDKDKIREHASFVASLVEDEGIDAYKTHVRECLKRGGIVYGNILDAGLSLPTQVGYDVVNSSGRWSGMEMVTANFSVEEVSHDRELFERGMKNVMEKVKLGGFLSMTTIRNAEWYKVGNQRMPATSITEQDMQLICAENNFEIEMLQVLEGSNKEEHGYDGMVFVLARRKGENV